MTHQHIQQYRFFKKHLAKLVSSFRSSVFSCLRKSQNEGHGGGGCPDLLNMLPTLWWFQGSGITFSWIYPQKDAKLPAKQSSVAIHTPNGNPISTLKDWGVRTRNSRANNSPHQTCFDSLGGYWECADSDQRSLRNLIEDLTDTKEAILWVARKRQRSFICVDALPYLWQTYCI